MPGVVTSTTGTLENYPASKFSSFSLVHTRETAINEYPDGSRQTRKRANNMKRRWQVSHRLTTADAATLRTFWKAHLTTPFNFTDVSNSVTYKAVFSGGWQEERGLGDRYQISLELLEVA